MIHSKISFLILFFCAISLFAQNANEDFKKVRLFFINNSALSMEVELVNFETQNDTKGKVVANGKMYKSGSNYYSKLENDEMICNGKNTIIADHAKKLIIVFGSVKPNKSMQIEENINEIISSGDSIKYNGSIKGIKKYTIYTPYNDIVKTEVFINTENYTPKKIVYYYAPESNEVTYESFKLEIEYTSISTEKVDKKWFNINHYVVQNKNGTYEPAFAYSNYKLKVVEE